MRRVAVAALVRWGFVLPLGLGATACASVVEAEAMPDEDEDDGDGGDPGDGSDPDGPGDGDGDGPGDGGPDGGGEGGGDDDDDAPSVGPGPWDEGFPLPAEPQTDGDPTAGWHRITEDTILTCGVPALLWPWVSPALGDQAPAEPLPGRTGEAADLPYSWTLHTPPSGVKMVSQNCLTCHAGYFDGELVVGLGNAHADYTTDLTQQIADLQLPDLGGGVLGELTRWLDRVSGMGPNTVMRTVGTNPAEMVAISLVAHRDPQTLEWSDEPLLEIPPVPVPSDVPPWWRAKKKNALFYNAMARGDHRGTMMLATSLCTDTVEEAEAVASHFNNVHAFVRSVQAPAYPFAIDDGLAADGEALFNRDCAGCHGTYGASDDEDTYPNLLLPLDVIGTDPIVAEGGTLWTPWLVDWYNESYYGTITRMEPSDPWPGYAAPPLDGVWATGPFFHNGSVPNIALVLDSTRRPTYWSRVDYDSTNFDEASLGWPYLVSDVGHDALPPEEAKFVYDTTQFAHGNGGHTFGDHLSDDERAAVLEYLKTL